MAVWFETFDFNNYGYPVITGRHGTPGISTLSSAITFSSLGAGVWVGMAIKASGAFDIRLFNNFQSDPPEDCVHQEVHLKNNGDNRTFVYYHDDLNAVAYPVTFFQWGPVQNISLRTGLWYYLELWARLISSTECDIQVRVNEESMYPVIWPIPLVNPIPGNSFWTNVSVIGAEIDDLYIDNMEASGLYPQGDFTSWPLHPNAAGDRTGWYPTPGPNNWDMVKDVTPDEDSSYVATHAFNDRDLYGLEDLSAGANILGVEGIARARVSGAYGEPFSMIYKYGGRTWRPRVDHTVMHNYYEYYTDSLPTSPFSSGAPWTSDEINNMQLGLLSGPNWVPISGGLSPGGFIGE